MSYCKKCGSKLKKGDNFCEQCGCPVSQESNGKNNSNNNSNINNNLNSGKCSEAEMSKMFKNLSKYVKESIQHPVKAIQDCDNKISQTESYILFVFLSIVYGLISVMYVKSFESNIKLIINKTMNGLCTLFNSSSDAEDFSEELYNKYLLTIHINYKGIFIYQFLVYFICGIILLLSCYLIMKYISKVNVNLLAIFKIVVTSLIPLTFFAVVEWIVYYITPMYSIIFIFMGIILSIISFYKGIEAYIGKYHKNNAYIAAGSYLILIIAQMLLAGVYVKNIIDQIKIL